MGWDKLWGYKVSSYSANIRLQKDNSVTYIFTIELQKHKSNTMSCERALNFDQ